MFDVNTSRDSPRPTVHARPRGNPARAETGACDRPHDRDLGRRERSALHHPPLEFPNQPRTILDDEAVDRLIDRLPYAVAPGHKVEHRERARFVIPWVGPRIELQFRTATTAEIKQ